MVLIARDARLRIVGLVAVAVTLGEDVVIDRIARPSRHLEIARVDGLAVAANGLLGVRQRGHFSGTHGALFACPIDRLLVVAVDVLLALDGGEEVVAVDSWRARHPLRGPAAFAARHGDLHHGFVVQFFLVAAQVAALNDQLHRLDAFGCCNLKAQRRVLLDRTEWRLVLRAARIEGQAQSDRIVDRTRARVGKAQRANVELRLLGRVEGQAQCLLSVEFTV